ncbi:tol-pal system YbgF family protein [Planctomycetota bacterium]
MKSKSANLINRKWYECVFYFFLVAHCMLVPALGQITEADSNTIDFEKLKEKYSDNANFQTYMAKLRAAELLAADMVSQLEKARKKQLNAFSDTLFGNKAEIGKGEALGVSPAREIYKRSKGLFSQPISLRGFSSVEQKFLSGYYNLKLRSLLNEIAEAGRALAVAEPSFKGTYDYVLVLPLLHTKDVGSVNVNSLPQWMQQAEILDALADSCLLHYGFLSPALNLAKKACVQRSDSCDDVELYRCLAGKCGKHNVTIAVQCLEKAIEYLSDNDLGAINELRFDIAQRWTDLGSYKLAAGQLKKIAQNISDSNDAEDTLLKIIKIYAEQLKFYDDAIEQCRVFLGKFTDSQQAEYVQFLTGKLTYLNKDYAGAATKFDLFQMKYPDSAYVSEAMLLGAISQLSQGQTDEAIERFKGIIQRYPEAELTAHCKFLIGYAHISNQKYFQALQTFGKLVEQFPDSKYASQAQTFIDRLGKVYK